MLTDLIKPLLSFLGIEKTLNLERVLLNSGWLFLDNIIRLFIGLAVTTFLARYLGPDNFGRFNYALAFVSLFSTFAIFGLNEIVVRVLVEDQQRRNDILVTAFSLRCFAGCVALISCLFFINRFGPTDGVSRSLVDIIAVGLIFQAFDVIDSYFQSQLLSKYTIWVKNSIFVILSFLKLYLIFIKASLIAFAWVGLAESVCGAIGLLIAARAINVITGNFRFDKTIAVLLIKSCWPIILSGIAFAFNMRIDQVMLEYFKGPHEVGVYSLAVKISEIWYALGVIIASAFPIIVKLKNENEIIYHLKLRQLYKVLYFLGFLASLITIILAKPVFHLLFGSAYEQSIPVLMIHVLGLTVILFGGATTYILIAENLQKYQLYRTLIGCISNVIFNLIFIPRWGVQGAAWASVISYTVCVYSIYLFKPARKIL